MIRLTFVALAAVAMFAPLAHADMTVKNQDGTMALTLPNGWHELKPQGAETQIVATDGRGARVVVHSYSKEDFKDMKAVAGFSATRLKLIEAPEQKFEDIDVNGKPGVRVELMGTEPNGMKRGFVITVFEIGGQYIDVVAMAHASAFTKNAQVLKEFAKQIVLAESPTTPAPAPAASTSPAANPAATTPPKPQPPARH